MFGWVIWAILLILQNSAFTAVSRARNSGSIMYHAVAAIFSNGIFFASQFILVDKFIKILKGSDVWLAVVTGLFYMTFTIVGSVSMHYIALNYLEKGKRKVGA